MHRRMLLWSFGLLAAVSLATAGGAGAQELRMAPGGDHIAPQIKHDVPAREVPGRKPLTIDAIVTDNVHVAKVTLFYRTMGSAEYAEQAMVPTVGDRYAAVLDSAKVVDPGIEYYIQAADEAGNTALRGFSFSPLLVAVGAASPMKEIAKEEEAGAVKPWYKKPVVWAVVGGVVAAAALAGGGGGGGSAASGTVVVSGPTP